MKVVTGELNLDKPSKPKEEHEVAESDSFNSVGHRPTTSRIMYSDPEGVGHRCDPFRVNANVRPVTGAMPPPIEFIPSGDIDGIFKQFLRLKILVVS